MNENCWCSSCVHTALFHLDVVKLVPGDQYIATLDLIERFKFFTEIPKCASVWTELFSASIPLPCTLLCHHFVMKAVLTLLFVLFPHVSGDFLHFPMGWCHGSSPDEIRGKPVHHNREIPWANVISYKKEALQEEMSFGGPREICWVTLWVGLKQSSEPQKGQDRVFKDLRQDYWLFFLKQPPSCSERVAEEVFSGPRIAFGSHLPPGLFVRDFSQPSAPLHICPFWCPSFFSIFFGPEDTKNEFVFLPDNCILEKAASSREAGGSMRTMSCLWGVENSGLLPGSNQTRISTFLWIQSPWICHLNIGDWAGLGSTT